MEVSMLYVKIQHLFLSILRKFYQNGISMKFRRILRNLYTKTKIDTTDPGSSTAEDRYVDMEKGTLTGGIMSPTLFSLYLNNLQSFITNNEVRGLMIDGKNKIFR